MITRAQHDDADALDTPLPRPHRQHAPRFASGTHPQISWAGECYQALKRRVRDGLHRQLVVRLARRTPSLCLDWRRGWRIVYLLRRDVATSVLSETVASMSKRWYTSVEQTRLPSLARLDPLAFMSAVRHRLALNDQVERSLSDLADLLLHLQPPNRAAASRRQA